MRVALGFSRGGSDAAFSLVVFGLIVQQLLLLNALFRMMPFLLRKAIPSDNVCWYMSFPLFYK